MHDWVPFDPTITNPCEEKDNERKIQSICLVTCLEKETQQIADCLEKEDTIAANVKHCCHRVQK
jgi:hypothetical protein